MGYTKLFVNLYFYIIEAGKGLTWVAAISRARAFAAAISLMTPLCLLLPHLIAFVTQLGVAINIVAGFYSQHSGRGWLLN